MKHIILALLLLTVGAGAVFSQPVISTFIPAGTTAQRPTTPKTGEIRINTTLVCLEYWDGAAWDCIEGGDPTDEGALTVGAGGANDATIISNTTGSTPVTISGGAGIAVTENPGTGVITITAAGGVNAQTGVTYPLVLADAEKLVTRSNAGANTLTVPPNSDVAFPVGTVINVASIGLGQTTIEEGVGVTIGSAEAKLKLRVQYSSASLIKLDTNTWLLVGDITN